MHLPLKYFIRALLSAAILIFTISSAKAYDDKEIIERANVIMKNIYNDIWRIRDRYSVLRDFSLDNYSDTPRLASPFQVIKSIHIKDKYAKQNILQLFPKEGFVTNTDIIYICFSNGVTEFANNSVPMFRTYISDLNLYLLIYSNSDNNFLNHDIKNIVKQNAKVVEPVTY